MRRNRKEGRKSTCTSWTRQCRWKKIELLSANVAEKTAMTAAESPYRVTAETISSTCGQSVSHGGGWNLVQRLGEKVSKEESHAVRWMESGEALGKEILLVLFEEMAGVWLSMQDEKHQKMKKQEIKIFTMYEGWKAEDGGRSSLVNKTMLAGRNTQQTRLCSVY